MLKKQKAFTLAEVLITLAVIGVVAALTIPTVMKSSEEAQCRTGAKHAMSTLSQALKMMEAEQNLPDFTSSCGATSAECQMAFMNAFCDKLKCLDSGAVNEFFADYYNYYKSSSGEDWSTDTSAGILLPNGMTALPYNHRNGCTTGRGAITTICGWLIVDTNGKKSPNMYGKDLVRFYIIKENNAYRFVPTGSLGDNRTCEPGSIVVNTSYGCTAYYLDGRELP